MSDLHLVRLVLNRRAAARKVTRGGWDEGYFLHATLTWLFDNSKVPLLTFCKDDTFGRGEEQDNLFLLAYSELDEERLLQQMGPDQGELLRQCITRPVPLIPAHTTVQFRTRVCPVVRVRKNAEGEHATDQRGRKRSREVDAWLAARFSEWTEHPPEFADPWERSRWEWTYREQVYDKWLTQQIQRQIEGQNESECPKVLGRMTMESFQRQRLYRKGGTQPERPDVVLTGTLRVHHSDAFHTLLKRGIGRHRAFGFGMLRIRA